MSLSPNDAVARLRDGNARFSEDVPVRVTASDAALRGSLAAGQQPFAVIIGCADSRVPVEAVFDQAAGDLFVIRVAGNLAGKTQVASAEYAVGQLGCRLILVLGHSGCGAVAAARDPSMDGLPDALGELVADIRTAIVGTDTERDAIEANVRHAVSALSVASVPVRDAVERGDLVVAGAIYDLATGVVDFLEE